MKLLEYKVAWIENQRSEVEGFLARLSSYVGRFGFQLNVEWVDGSSQLNKFLKALDSSSDYDLILVDWKLGAMLPESQSGATVAKEIRYKNPPSYVVFYSSESRSTLIHLIAGEKIDGVYCVSRQHFVSETTDIIKASIRRFEDIETMRGIFLSAVASFDSIVSEAICQTFDKLPDSDKIKITEAFVNRLSKFYTDRHEKIANVDRSLSLSELLSKLKPGSSQELSCLIDIMSLGHPSVNHRSSLTKLKAYQSEFLPGRNDLAHVEETKLDDGKPQVLRGDRSWSPADIGQYRQLIVDHHDNLVYIRDGLLKELIEYLESNYKAVTVADQNSTNTKIEPL